MARIVVAGMVAGVPGNGGAAWAALQWALSAESLGHDVTVIEEVSGELRATSARYMARCRHALRMRAPALIWSAQHRRSEARLHAAAACRRADVLVNLAGTLRDPQLLEAAPRRVYVDLDPGFTQWWSEDGIGVGLEGHTHYATVGGAVGLAGCLVPTLGLDWIRILPPVALDRWSVAPRPTVRCLTTVANWRSYGSVQRGATRFGQKAHAVRELLDLPRRITVPISLALAIDAGDSADRAALQRAGWGLTDPRVASTVVSYRDWIRSSWAEIGVAKHGYVSSRSGWFSDRSACYLAAGRPVVAAATGHPLVGADSEGIRTFADLDQAVTAIEDVQHRYAEHAAAARAFAEEHLDGTRIVHSLLEQVGG